MMNQSSEQRLICFIPLAMTRSTTDTVEVMVKAMTQPKIALDRLASKIPGSGPECDMLMVGSLDTNL
jgi:hypothetical protein